MSTNVLFSNTIRAILLLTAPIQCLAQSASDPLSDPLIENLFSGRRWQLTEIREDNTEKRPESTVWFLFRGDSTGIREEQSVDSHQNPLVVRSRFRYQINVVAGERVIRFREVALDSGRNRNINTEPRLRHTSQFGIRLVQRNNRPCIRMTQASGNGSRPTFHYYFE